ncbi:MAG TPA: heparinase II/III family protein [Gemmatimonadaceae bacterium]|nr:heparinase II/III family protein [Gemmatimonadaceae bacterium]
MSLLIDESGLLRRRDAAAGPLASLATSLRRDLDPALAMLPEIPTGKAWLARGGGRCPADGTLLAFDPFRARHHQCPRCGRAYSGEAHDRYALMWRHLWLAERAVHGALLFALTADDACARLAAHVMAGYAERYLAYPNRDNALGPSRPFFSTYLESIWLLQLAVALDLLELAGLRSALGGQVRDRVLEPGAALVASFNEGASNRQVWNAAALAATAPMLGRPAQLDDALFGPGGIAAHLRRGLLSDGSWYEGENYHLFAHRGLWYGVTIAETSGALLPAPLVGRFEQGFVVPFVTALPDFTFPSRRDSQYAVTLRQWRVAESAELGLARRPDDVPLRGALAELYRADVPRGDTGRARSTAEAERNEPPARLTRADLGWRALLRALPQLPTLAGQPPRSALLDGQGLAVLRRDAGRVYVGLDYGHSGGGHGHPDRLNVLLADGAVRWLDDPGTGSYVERTLHWYRSTLAHNAPLVDGRSQERVHGRLRAYEDRGGAAWVDAEVGEIAAGVIARRALVVVGEYAVDELTWESDREVTLDLPSHLDADVAGAEWVPHLETGAGGLEDGFDFLSRTERDDRAPQGALRLSAAAGGTALDGWTIAEPAAAVWRAIAPGPPGRGHARFVVFRQRARRGRIATVWSWRGRVNGAAAEGPLLAVTMADGTRHTHERAADCWRVGFAAGGARSTIDLGGVRPAVPAAAHDAPIWPVQPVVLLRLRSAPLPAASWLADAADDPRTTRFALAGRHYRRTEESWEEAGAPSASVYLAADPEGIVAEADVRKAGPLTFVAAGYDNILDNEHAETNGDGLQLYLETGGRAGGAPDGWRVVPVEGAADARVTPVAGLAGARPLPVARWVPTAAGYRVQVRIPVAGLGAGARLRLDVAVNEKPPGRERRRGQLLLSGGAGEFLYLQGDRIAPERWLPFRLDE